MNRKLTPLDRIIELMELVHDILERVLFMTNGS